MKQVSISLRILDLGQLLLSLSRRPSFPSIRFRTDCNVNSLSIHIFKWHFEQEHSKELLFVIPLCLHWTSHIINISFSKSKNISSSCSSSFLLSVNSAPFPRVTFVCKFLEVLHFSLSSTTYTAFTRKWAFNQHMHLGLRCGVLRKSKQMQTEVLVPGGAYTDEARGETWSHVCPTSRRTHHFTRALSASAWNRIPIIC